MRTPPQARPRRGERHWGPPLATAADLVGARLRLGLLALLEQAVEGVDVLLVLERHLLRPSLRALQPVTRARSFAAPAELWPPCGQPAPPSAWSAGRARRGWRALAMVARRVRAPPADAGEDHKKESHMCACVCVCVLFFSRSLVSTPSGVCQGMPWQHLHQPCVAGTA